MFSSELHRSTVGLRLAHPFGAPWHADRGAGTSCKYQPGFSLHYAWAPVSFVPFHLFAKAQLTFEKFTQTPKCFNNHTLPPAAPALWAVSIHTDRLTWAGCLWRIPLFSTTLQEMPSLTHSLCQRESKTSSFLLLTFSSTGTCVWNTAPPGMQDSAS